ncbi:uncharacterized protein G2W53_037224 [Senna tora]|uniref:Uncharacterized protein n=1 Tax=Senna tora TaxID=362788 RepID=A0A834SWX2_9FABA|nr:uncharacterized protein G2W53_037224 [Senna tora]
MDHLLKELLLHFQWLMMILPDASSFLTNPTAVTADLSWTGIK